MRNHPPLEGGKNCGLLHIKFEYVKIERRKSQLLLSTLLYEYISNGGHSRRVQSNAYCYEVRSITNLNDKINKNRKSQLLRVYH